MANQDSPVNRESLCTACGARMVGASNFCSECGTPAEAARPDATTTTLAEAAAPAAQVAPASPPSAPSRRPPPPPPPPRAPSPEQVAIKDVWTPPQTNVLAIVSLTLSILWIGWLGSLGAVILGHMAKRQIADSHGRQTGAGLATAGLVIGYIGLGFLLVYVIAAASIS